MRDLPVSGCLLEWGGVFRGSVGFSISSRFLSHHHVTDCITLGERFNFLSSNFLIWKLKSSDENVYKGPSSVLAWQAINNCSMNRCNRMVDHLPDDQLQLWQYWREGSFTPPSHQYIKIRGEGKGRVKRHHGDPVTSAVLICVIFCSASCEVSVFICNEGCGIGI